MTTISEFETTLNFSPVEQYVHDVDQLVLQKLRKRVYYEGKCSNNTLVVKVINIKTRSCIELRRDSLEGSGTMFVQFVASVLTYYKDSILTGCIVQSLDAANQMIMCSAPSAIISVTGGVSPSPASKSGINSQSKSTPSAIQTTNRASQSNHLRSVILSSSLCILLVLIWKFHRKT